MNAIPTQVTFLCYHYIRRDDEFSRIWGHDFELFKKHITFLKQNYTMVTMGDVSASMCGERMLPQNCAVVTFDDSLAEHARLIAPYLETEGIRGLFNISPNIFKSEPLMPQVVHFGTAYYGIRKFTEIVKEYICKEGIDAEKIFSTMLNEVNVHTLHKNIKLFLKYKLSNKVEQSILSSIWHQELVRDVPDIHQSVYMTESELKELSAAGHSIGLHTSTHALVNDDTFTDQLFETEIIQPKQVLEDITGTAVTVFAYPYAYKKDVLYNINSINRIRSLGIDMLLTIFQKEKTQQFDSNFIGRYSSYSTDSVENLANKLWAYEISNTN